MEKRPAPELEELIESIERTPPPSRPGRRFPRRLTIALLGIAAFFSLLSLLAPSALVAIVSDPLRAASLALETIGNSISILLR